ncbi:MAG: 50S ribosomal protein L21 [Deltaproteobacteria bacterium]|nr:50S ribosomal protein L21 [Deltaproteobacteria bacterium]
MYAVIQTGGKQYRVTPGEEVKVEKLPGQIGDQVYFDKVLLTSDGDKVAMGKPYLEKAKVVGHITNHRRDKKIVVFTFKRRKGFKKKQGHRQDFSLIRIDAIEA